jgi:hypothetical protein
MREDFATAKSILEHSMLTWFFDEIKVLQCSTLVVPCPLLGACVSPFDKVGHPIREQIGNLKLADGTALRCSAAFRMGCGIIRVLDDIGQLVVNSLPNVLCTPGSFMHGPLFLSVGERVVDPAPDPVDCDDVDDDIDEDTTQRHSVWKLLQCVKLMMLMRNPETMDEVIKLASAFALSADAHCKFVEGDNRSIPSRTTVHRAAVKIDYLAMLYQRRLFARARANGDRWKSQFAGDSSPQVTFDFMNYVEERFVFSGTDEEIAARVIAVRSLLECFKHVRRAFACQVLGMANAGVAQKYVRFVKDIRMETDADDLQARREDGVGWLADQGADLAVGDAQNSTHEDLPTLIHALDAGSTDFSSGAGRDGYFLPNSITLAEMLHQLFGGLKDSLVATEA